MTKYLLLYLSLLAFAGCEPYHDGRYTDGYGYSHDRYDTRAHDKFDHRNDYYGNDESARHEHMDAEREHLRQEQADDARRHYERDY